MWMDLLKQDLPVYFELGLSNDATRLKMAITNGWWGRISGDAGTFPRLEELNVAFKADKNGFGYGDVFERMGSNPHVTFFESKLPVMRDKEGNFLFDKGLPLCRTLAIVMLYLSFDEPIEDEKWDKKQLLHLVPGADMMVDGSGFGMTGAIGSPVVKWIAANGNVPFVSVKNAMIRAYSAMNGRRENVHEMEFRAMVSDKKLSSFVLGAGDSRSGVYAVPRRTDDLGLSLESCNMDNPQQQLAVIAGLAHLCDLIRNET